MVKENAVYPYNGLLVSNKKEQIIDMCYIEGSQILNKVARHKRLCITWTHLYKISRKKKIYTDRM